MRVIALLAWWQLWNALRTTFTQPRKLIPLIVFAVAIGFQIFIQIFASSIRPSMRYGAPGSGQMSDETVHLLNAAVFLILALFGLMGVSNGILGSSLQFSPGDADYLFPTPLPRRLVLAYRIPAMLFQPLLISFFITIAVRSFLRTSSLAQMTQSVAIAPFFTAFFLTFTAYQQAGLALYFFLRPAYHGFIRFALTAIALALLVIGGLAFQLHGMDGLAGFAGNPLLRVVFAPCALGADGVLGGPVLHTFVPLALIFIASIGLVFIRETNYYEIAVVNVERVAKVREAARAGDIGAAFRMRQSRTRRGVARRAYTIPPFGSGGTAILWAHLAAGAKNPLVNFIAPFFAGMAVSIVAGYTSPEHAAMIAAGADAYVILLVLQVSSRGLCRRVLQLQQIIRPFPVHASRVVAADIIPAAIPLSLFGWGSALPLLLNPDSVSQSIALMLLFVAPSVVLSKLLMQYLLTFWYPNTQDKLQQMISSLIALVLTGVHFAFLGPCLIIPFFLHAPAWLTVGLNTIVSLGLTLVWLAIAVSAYTRYQPQEDGAAPAKRAK